MNTYFTVAAAALAFVASVNGHGPQHVRVVLVRTSLPTAEQTAAMCKVDACHELIKNVQATNPPDCDLKIPTSGAVMNVKSLADNFEPGCKSSTTTDAPVASTAAPAAAATTAAPSPESTTATPSQGAETTASVATPAATTTAPTAC